MCWGHSPTVPAVSGPKIIAGYQCYLALQGADFWSKVSEITACRQNPQGLASLHEVGRTSKNKSLETEQF